jgi:hypothetical protein
MKSGHTMTSPPWNLSDADRAGFIEAVGWCSGWRTWLTLIEGKLDDSNI